MKRGRRRAVVAVGVIALSAVAWWAWASIAPQSDGSWVEVRRDDLVLGVEVEGRLRATHTSLMGPPQLRDFWEYKIAHMAPEGETVEVGQPVLAFDTSELRQRLERRIAEAEEASKQIEKTEKNLSMNRRRDELRLVEAEARLRKAQLKLDRPGELASAQELALARLDLELAQTETAYLRDRMAASERSAEAQLGALRNQQETAERKVADIRTAIEEMVRPATREGTVIYVTDWQDQKKKVGDTCWRGENVIELPDLTTMEAEGRVNEADAGKLEEHQRVTLRLDAHPDAEFTGSIASIWKTVQTQGRDNPLKVARLQIELDETDTRKMRPGMRFRGRVETERVEGSLLLPLEAVFRTPEGAVAFRRTSWGFDMIRLTLGRRNATHVEVVDGLSEGDQVSLVDLRENAA